MTKLTEPEPIDPARPRPEPARQVAARAIAEPAFTGHEWDGIREYDNPLPRWWLWIFYATIVWSLIYWLLFPAWPLVSQATQGVLGYSTRASAAAELEAAQARNAPLDARIMESDLAAIADDPELLRFATAGGGAVFRNHCGQCHGAGAQGALGGYPNLLDDSWLWGGTVEAIHQTIAHGIRYDPDPDTRYSEMPAFGAILEEAEIAGLAEYVLALSGAPHDAALAAGAAENYEINCSACHGLEGEGNTDLGAPALNDAIWLYGGDRETILHSIRFARYGIMPAFQGRLRDVDVRKVAVYVHTLGGGQ
jgi:cytochrome c oxidase cbb3-type subunit III